MQFDRAGTFVAGCCSKARISVEEVRHGSSVLVNRKLHDAKKAAIFAMLHTPPKDLGFNRTTWRRKDLHAALVRNGVDIGKNYLDLIVRNEGYPLPPPERSRRALRVGPT